MIDDMCNGGGIFLTKSLRRLIIHDIDMQNIMAMRLARRNFKRLLQDGTTRVFSREISHGFSWTR